MVKTDESMVEAKAWLKCLRNGLDILPLVNGEVVLKMKQKVLNGERSG